MLKYPYFFLMMALFYCANVQAEVVSPNYSVSDFFGATRSGASPGEACAYVEVENYITSCADGSSSSYTLTHTYTLSGASCKYVFTEGAVCELAASSFPPDYLPIAEDCSLGFALTGTYCTSDSDNLDEENALGGPDIPEDDCLTPG